MVCGEAVDNVQVLPQRIHVLPGAQHGSHLRSPIADLRQVVVAQEQVVRCHLARHLDALLLGGPDDQDLSVKGGEGEKKAAPEDQFYFRFSLRKIFFVPSLLTQVLQVLCPMKRKASSYLLLLGHVADVHRSLVELSHHQDGGHRLLLSVCHDGKMLGPLLKVLPGEQSCKS